MTTKVIKGSLWTLAGQVGPMLFSLIATPVNIRLLGSEGYGVLVLVALIPSYFAFADLGMSMGSTKFSSEAFAAGDPGREARIIRTAALIALAGSIPVAILIFLFSGWIAPLFNVPDRLVAEASLALKFASVTFVVTILNGILNTPQLNRLRMDLNSLVGFVPKVLGIVLTPIVIYLGGGIVGATAVLMSASFLTLAAHFLVSRRLLPELGEPTLERPAIRTLLKFGGPWVLGALAGLLLGNLEKGTLSAFISPKALAYYSVAFTLATMVTMFAGSVTQSLLPAFSQLQGESNRAQMNALYSRGISLNLYWLVPAVSFLAVVAGPFFTVWAGEEFGRESIVPFYILLAGIFVNVLAFFPYTALIAAGRTDLLARLYWIELVPHIFFVGLLTWRFGIIGAALSWSIRLWGDSILLFILAQRMTGAAFARKHMSAFALAAAVMMLPAALSFFYAGLPLLMVLLAIALAVYTAIIWKKVLERDEAAWLSERFNMRFAG